MGSRDGHDVEVNFHHLMLIIFIDRIDGVPMFVVDVFVAVVDVVDPLSLMMLLRQWLS